MLIDLDDTLYAPDSGVWGMVSARINQYIHEKLGVSDHEIPTLRQALFLEYGTTLRGLQHKFQVDMKDYLDFVDNVPLEDRLQPDPQLRDLLLRYPQRKFIITNADRCYAQRVIHLLELDGCFEGIIDIYDIAPFCKPMVEAFQIAFRLAGVNNPAQCIFMDDSPRNLAAANQLGAFTVLVGQPKPGSQHLAAGASVQIDRIVDLPTILSPSPDGQPGMQKI